MINLKEFSTGSQLGWVVMTNEEMQKYGRKIMGGGPDRVVISSDGVAVTPARARHIHNIEFDVVFLRKDGWSLGAPRHLKKVAEDLWIDEWVGMLVKPDRTMHPYLRLVTGNNSLRRYPRGAH